MTLLYFLLAISVLVVIHEYGHFWVARRCGVYVKRFSVGFGKPLWSFKDKYGTEYAIAPIPMGGYVSMLDEREGEVPPERLHQAFNRKSPWQRIAIAAAGPLANFLFAIAAYWFIFASGTTGLAPVIGEVKADSPAALAGIYAGDEIIAIAGKPINTWEDVNWRLVGFIGETADIAMSLQSEDGSQHQVTVQVNAWLANNDEPNPIADLGLLPRRLTIPAVLGEVLPDGAAWRAGLEKGDKILQVNDETVNDWFQWVEVVKNAPDQELQLQLERNGELLSLKLTPAARPDAQGKLAGFVGASVEIPQYPADWLRVRQLGVMDALTQGLEKTYDTIVFTLDSLWKMLKGMLSVKNLSGPVSIAKVAGASASGGLESFVSFLALLSISLGVLNLLPVPVLDGGHIVFCLAEIIRGKPLPEYVQQWAIKVGMFLLLGIMLVAFYNDLGRL